MEHEIRSSRFYLALHSLNEAVTNQDRMRMLRFGGAGVVIQVPSADWVPAMRMAAEKLTRFNHVIFRTGSSRSSDKPDQGNAEVADFLGASGRVLGISQSPDLYLPSALVSAADVRIKIGTPFECGHSQGHPQHHRQQGRPHAQGHRPGPQLRRPRRMPAEGNVGRGVRPPPRRGLEGQLPPSIRPSPTSHC